MNNAVTSMQQLIFTPLRNLGCAIFRMTRSGHLWYWTKIVFMSFLLGGFLAGLFGWVYVLGALLESTQI